ncbi:uncharacterized protein LOC132921887 [Rhopalosiphum padi]|uniref:uncharacterized protein LOC132921887 n=1 Tax=Rhopalosiphum padi TaxID=40932 RepID=UPI00298E0B03|nr:uncharacterized protein LOC132921887 [Rhopalosiphum padi]
MKMVSAERNLITLTMVLFAITSYAQGDFLDDCTQTLTFLGYTGKFSDDTRLDITKDSVQAKYNANNHDIKNKYNEETMYAIGFYYLMVLPTVPNAANCIEEVCSTLNAMNMKDGDGSALVYVKKAAQLPNAAKKYF